MSLKHSEINYLLREMEPSIRLKSALDSCLYLLAYIVDVPLSSDYKILKVIGKSIKTGGNIV